jgi:hypothetical protein
LIGNLIRDKNALDWDNYQLGNYIKNLDNSIIRLQEDYNFKISFFNTEKQHFACYKKTEELKLDKKKADIKRREKNVEIRENKAIEYDLTLNVYNKYLKELNKEFSMKNNKEKNELNKKKIEIEEDQRCINNEWEKINKIKKEQKDERLRLQKWQINLEKTGGFNKFLLPCPDCGKPMLFDITNKEIYEKIKGIFGNYIHHGCIKNKQPIKLHLNPLSGEPIIQSGFSPIIQSNIEKISVDPNGGHVVQSGSPIIQSGEKEKVVMSGGEPILQSGFSDC